MSTRPGEYASPYKEVGVGSPARGPKPRRDRRNNGAMNFSPIKGGATGHRFALRMRTPQCHAKGNRQPHGLYPVCVFCGEEQFKVELKKCKGKK